jgi:pimeloyl-ACP methyl ester carboxylesterase
LNVPDLIHLIEGLLKEYAVSKVSLMGYSLGGRVCLALIAALPAMIEAVLLHLMDFAKTLIIISLPELYRQKTL